MLNYKISILEVVTKMKQKYDKQRYNMVIVHSMYPLKGDINE